MKRIFFITSLIFVFAICLLNAKQSWSGNTSNQDNISSIVSNFPVQDVSEEEKEGLIKMRQEEKLARDVYLKLYEKWNLNVFSNISKSEQTHMDAVKAILDKYNIEDPVTSDDIGVFKDEEFTELFNQLVTQGNKSVVDALKVGATIEDLDIEDLQNLIAKTDNEDIKYVYNNLMNGSFNHLRAFTNSLKQYGETYTPQYITEEEYEKILSEDTQHGAGESSGCFSVEDVNNLKSGWFLGGTGCNIDNLTIFNNVKSVWIWDNNIWKVYSPEPEIENIILKYKIPSITLIPSKRGFWINK